MKIQLPSTALRLLRDLLVSYYFYPVSLLVIGLALWTTRSKEVLFDRDHPLPSLTYTQIILTAGIWLATDVAFGSFRSVITKRLFLFLRNASALLIGIGFPRYIVNRKSFPLTTWTGRLRPFTKFVSFGLFSGLIIIVIILGVSLVHPFHFDLQPPNRVTSIDHFTLLGLSTILIPLTEELFFRLYLYSFFRKRLGVIAGMIMTSLVFGFTHGLRSVALLIGMESMALLIFLEHTRSILPGLVLHGGFNTLILYGTFLF